MFEDSRGLDSLPVAADWQEWWQLWGPQIAARHGKAGWILFLLDAQEKIQEITMLVSRILRNKPKWDDRGWSAKEWENVEEHGAAALGWFDRNAEQPYRDAPDWARFLLRAQFGNLTVLTRVTRELRGLQENGYRVAVLERTERGVEWDENAVQIAMEESS